MDPFEPYRPSTDPSPEQGERVPSNRLAIQPPPRPAPTAARSDDAGPRWWTPLAVIVLSLALFLTASAILSFTVVFLITGMVPSNEAELNEGLEAAFASRVGLFAMIVLPQLALVAAPVLAAMCSSVPTRRRLALVRGHWPIWAWVAGAAATPLVGMVSGLVVGQFMEESESLKQMTQIFRGHGENGFLIPLALMIGATPAICEELLFRGYVQTRMTRAMGPLVGVGFASFLFAIFHMDFVHVIAVFPLGLFLGWITWQSGSIFPAMLGHFVNNVISVIAVVIAVEPDPDVLALPAITFTVAILGAGILGMAAVSVASVAYGSPESNESGMTPSGTQLV